ncbi:hypothetical protein DKY63_28375 [Pseudomonas putida]|uniref:Uncharacterized protein n=1 Tax=Pseudomonas putida TaxID=303 RepID=A0A2Z4RRI4_PSEPU|nr:hypothetical protein DKY63_28375 [Pseudomonas putida]
MATRFLYTKILSLVICRTSVKIRCIFYMKKSVGARLDFEKDLLILEKQMMKYINFRVVSGWKFWW